MEFIANSRLEAGITIKGAPSVDPCPSLERFVRKAHYLQQQSRKVVKREGQHTIASCCLSLTIGAVQIESLAAEWQYEFVLCAPFTHGTLLILTHTRSRLGQQLSKEEHLADAPSLCF